MSNSKDKKLFSVFLAILMTFTIMGAAVAAEESNNTTTSNITSNSTDCDKITKNVTNMNGNNSTINYNDYVNFTIVVRNDHHDTEQFRVNDTLPIGLEFVNYTATKGTYNATTGIWDIGNLTGSYHPHIHETATLNIIAKVIDSCVTITNTAKLEVLEKYWNKWTHCWVYYWDYEAKANTTFYVPCATDLGITKTVNNTNPKLNDYINIALNVTNNGPDNATCVTVNDLLPAGLKFISANTVTGSYNNNTGVWTIGNLINGASAILNIVAQVITSNVCITNTANVTGHEYDYYMANNTANATVCVPAQSSLYLNITAPEQCIGLNSIAQIIFKVGNNGPDAAQNVNMTWVIPQGMQFISAVVDSGTWEYIAATRTLIWHLGEVPVGDPWMWVTVRALETGNFLIAPVLSTSTYDPTLSTSVQFRNICVEAAEEVRAAGEPIFAEESIPMQETGMPIAMLVLAVLAVLGGLIVPRRK